MLNFSVWVNAFELDLFFSAIPNYLNQVHEIDMSPDQLWYCAAMNFTIVSCLLCSTYLLIAMTFERF